MAFTPLNTLNAYLEVARRRSFAGAARDLGVSPSAVSQATSWARPANFVFTIPIPVFTMPIRAFTFRRSRCSRWADLAVHDGPKSAAEASGGAR